MKDTDAAISFEPIASPFARILILGTMPGVKSLQENQYYAHPRNAFWRIMAEIYGFKADAPYESRVQSLTDAGVAVWDVLKSCERPGSLDKSIKRDSRVPNDFKQFFGAHPHVSRVFFNGAEAKAAFNDCVLNFINTRVTLFSLLPSSSPANAAPFDRKLRAWRESIVQLEGA